MKFTLNRNWRSINYQNRRNDLKSNTPIHVETSQLTCNSNRLTDFYMMEELTLNIIWLFTIYIMKQMLTFNIQSFTIAFMRFIPENWFSGVDYITQYFAHIFKWCYWFLLIYLDMHYKEIKQFKYII